MQSRLEPSHSNIVLIRPLKPLTTARSLSVQFDDESCATETRSHLEDTGNFWCHPLITSYWRECWQSAPWNSSMRVGLDAVVSSFLLGRGLVLGGAYPPKKQYLDSARRPWVDVSGCNAQASFLALPLGMRGTSGYVSDCRTQWQSGDRVCSSK